MFSRVLGWVLGLSLLVLLAAPFVHDVLNRYVYIKELYQLTDPVQRAALRLHYGKIGGFADDVAKRCRTIYGPGQPGCLRYTENLGD